MTHEMFHVEPAHFDFDIERDTHWPLPEARVAFPPQPLSLWERIVARIDAAVFGEYD